MEAGHHRVGMVLSVNLGDQETQFQVMFSCPCCQHLSPAWLPRSLLLGTYAYSEVRARQLEEQALKDKREQETRKVAEDMHNYLDFADVDWDDIQPSDFVQVNFEDSSLTAEPTPSIPA